MENHLAYLKNKIAAAQVKYKDNANRNREPAPIIKVGDKVWLNTRNIQIKRSLRKLNQKNLGQFKIKSKLNAWAYKLELLDMMQIYSVFHVLLLTPCAKDPLPEQTQPKAQLIKVNRDTSQEIEKIYDSKRTKGSQLQYLVKWVRTDAPTWEKAANLYNCAQLLTAFHQMYPNKPNINTSRGA